MAASIAADGASQGTEGRTRHEHDHVDFYFLWGRNGGRGLAHYESILLQQSHGVLDIGFVTSGAILIVAKRFMTSGAPLKTLGRARSGANDGIHAFA